MSIGLIGAKSCMVFSTALFATAVEQTQQPVNQWIPVFLAGFAAVSALMAYLQGKSNARTAKEDKEELALIAENNKKHHTDQIQELRITVDGKLSKLVDLSKEVSRAEGKAEGKSEERERSAKSTADKAEGKASANAAVEPLNVKEIDLLKKEIDLLKKDVQQQQQPPSTR